MIHQLRSSLLRVVSNPQSSSSATSEFPVTMSNIFFSPSLSPTRSAVGSMDAFRRNRSRPSKLKTLLIKFHFRAPLFCSEPLVQNKSQFLSATPLEVCRQIYAEVLDSYGPVQHITLIDGTHPYALLQAREPRVIPRSRAVFQGSKLWEGYLLPIQFSTTGKGSRWLGDHATAVDLQTCVSDDHDRTSGESSADDEY